MSSIDSSLEHHITFLERFRRQRQKRVRSCARTFQNPAFSYNTAFFRILQYEGKYGDADMHREQSTRLTEVRTLTPSPSSVKRARAYRISDFGFGVNLVDLLLQIGRFLDELFVRRSVLAVLENNFDPVGRVGLQALPDEQGELLSGSFIVQRVDTLGNGVNGCSDCSRDDRSLWRENFSASDSLNPHSESYVATSTTWKTIIYQCPYMSEYALPLSWVCYGIIIVVGAVTRWSISASLTSGLVVEECCRSPGTLSSSS